VGDVVGQLAALATEPRAVGEVFNVGNDREEISILDLAKRVKARAGSKSEIVLVPYEKAYEEGFEDMQRRVPDLSKLRALTDYRPQVQLDEILDRVIAYFTSDATRL
jgi:UDP-glucose 4-epimerase